jgi:hypothetical protein
MSYIEARAKILKLRAGLAPLAKYSGTKLFMWTKRFVLYCV